jgi:hypothetical protein
MSGSGLAVGFLAGMLGFALLSQGLEEEDAVTLEGPEDDDLEVNDYQDQKGQLYPLYCQNCRKQKKHREIKTNVYECTRCHRTTDLRKRA